MNWAFIRTAHVMKSYVKPEKQAVIRNQAYEHDFNLHCECAVKFSPWSGRKKDI